MNLMNLQGIAEEIKGLSDEEIERALNRLVARELNDQAMRRIKADREARLLLLRSQLRPYRA